MTEVSHVRVARVRPWAASAEDVCVEWGVDPAVGLASDEVERRLAADGPNELEIEPPPGAITRLVAQFRDPLVVLLLVAIVISLVAWSRDRSEGVPVDAIVIALVVIANAAIGMWQEGRAIDAVEALRRLHRPSTIVRRDGIDVVIPTGDVVAGDVVVLAEGDAVTADARIIDAATLEVDESALTGESMPVAKSVAPIDEALPLADRSPMIHSGTSVTRGHGLAVVVATGVRTEMGSIAGLVRRSEPAPTPLQRQIARLGRQLGLIVVAIASALVVAVLTMRGLDDETGLLDLLLAAVALAVAAVPEGLPAILAVVLALGVQRMAREGAIVKRLLSVETLGATTVICTDKTGTLTQNEMTVVEVAVLGGAARLTGVGYEPVGELVLASSGDGSSETPSRSTFVGVLNAAAASSNARLDGDGHGWRAAGDPTEVALVVAHRKAGGDAGVGAPDARATRVDEVAFDGARKLMSTLHRDDGGYRQFTKGAPEAVIDRCVAVDDGGAAVPMSGAVRRRIEETVDTWARRGLRTLAVARRDHDRRPEAFDETVEAGLTLLGVLAITDPLREAALGAVADARRAGIDVRMITGDHPVTALAIAAELGLGDGEVLTGRELAASSGQEMADRIATSQVFARVTPADKLRVVEELEDRGHVVAMTGDGVNDAPALRRADIGVAMGRAGTDVARDAADMVLTDDDFSTIVAAVREGREIYANIRKFLRYLLATNTGEVLVMLVGVLAAAPLGLAGAGADGAALPLLATQILWINLVTDTAPALALGVDPAVDEVMDRPPRSPAEPVIDRRMWATIAVIGVTTAVAGLVALDVGLVGGVLGGSGDIDDGRTMLFTTVVLAQLFNAFNARSDTTTAFRGVAANRLLLVSVGAALGAQVAVIHLGVLNRAFGTVPLDVGQWLVCTGLASSVMIASEVHKAIRRRAEAAPAQDGDAARVGQGPTGDRVGRGGVSERT